MPSSSNVERISLPDGWDDKRPRHLSPVTYTATEGEVVSDFIETFGVIVKESIGGSVGEPISLRTWQRQLINEIFALNAEGRRQHRTAFIGIARKNGKSALMAGIALYEFVLGIDGGEILIVAKDRDQARIIFETCLSMLKRSPRLADLFHKNRDVLTNKETGTTLRALSRDALSAEGTSPSLAIVDEVHAHPDDKLWNVLQEGKGARREPLLIGITTAGARSDRLGYDSLAYRLYQHGCRVASGEVTDDTFYFAWWEPLLGDQADWTDPATWAEANPGLDDLVSLESFHDSLARTPIPEFRTKRCNQWVATMNSALPAGRWEALGNSALIPDGEPVVLGFDGAISNDSTALVAWSLEGHLQTVGVWERPQTAHEWIVDADEVLDTIRLAAAKWQVLELAYDPAYWRHEMEALGREGIPAVEFPMSRIRMVPAWDSFYASVMAEEFTHDDNAAMTRHMSNLVVQQTPTGSYPTKESKNSQRKIDLAIAAIIGYDRMRWHRANRPSKRSFLVY